MSNDPDNKPSGTNKSNDPHKDNDSHNNTDSNAPREDTPEGHRADAETDVHRLMPPSGHPTKSNSEQRREEHDKPDDESPQRYGTGGTTQDNRGDNTALDE